ncbi:MAG: hypothetical protein HC915_05590 [Anaerolineae bacterium]|nr:hypothetical protein [Anaerolineae bacterium]
MPKRYSAILLALTLVVAFAVGLLIEPSESQANPSTGFRAEYFNNATLQGTPVQIVTDDQINFNWGTAAPRPGINADNFSVRWTATPNFAQGGLYRFRAGADDGIRIFVDDQLIIDSFIAGEFRTFTRDVTLAAGPHTIRVEYFELGNLAGVLVEWALVTAAGDLATAVPSLTPVPAGTIEPTPLGRVDALGARWRMWRRAC